MRVVVIGAGIGGLAAAVALAQRGIEVEVHERADRLGEVGAGLQLGPNAVKVLRGLGILDALLPLSGEPREILSLRWDDAGLRYREPLARITGAAFGDRYLTAHRADVHGLLAGLLPAGAIHLGRMCVGAATLGAVAVARFADGSEIEGDVVVGADGIHSEVRGALFGADAPRFTGQMAWRCMVPIAKVPRMVGPGGRVAIDTRDYVGWIGPNGHVICYPIRGGELWNIFAGHVTDEWVEESWSAPSSVDELLAAYEGWNPALLDMLAAVGPCFKWGIHDRDPLTAWSVGRVGVLGDAAHPMMPTLAQGAAMALEDGAALARCLAESGDAIDGLSNYDRERAPRAGRVQLQARQQFLNNKLVPPPPPLDRGWIFRHDAMTGQDLRSDVAVAPI